MFPNTKFYFAFIVTLFVLPIIGYDGRVTNEAAVSFEEVELAYTSSSSLVAHNNTELDNLGLPGSGTVGEPYVINNVNITDDSNCIELYNTTRYVSITNCFLSSVNEGSGFGVHLINATNINISACILEGKDTGFLMEECKENDILNCTISDCNDAVVITRSNQIRVESANISNCDLGIKYSKSNNCIALECLVIETLESIANEWSNFSFISSNQISGTITGVSIYASNDSIIESNEILAQWSPIRALFTNNLSVLNNYVNGSEGHGISCSGSETPCVIANNIVHHSGRDGISCHAPNITIQNNTIYNTTWYGIRLSDSSGSYVRENWIRLTGENGIGVENSSSVWIENNTVANSTWHGIATSASPNSTMISNRVYNSTFVGLAAHHSNNPVFRLNYVEDTGEYGLQASSSKNAYYANNTLVRTGGIVLEVESDSGRVYGNRLYDTFWTAMRTKESMDCILEYNEIYGVVEDGVLVDELSNNTVVTNNIIQQAGWQGLSVFNSSGCDFTHNKVSGITGNGMLILQAPETTALENHIVETESNGISLDDSPGSLIEKNKISSSEVHGINVYNTKNVRIFENLVEHVTLRGISIGDASSIEIWGNAINKSLSTDIWVGSSQDCIFFRNAFLTGGSHGAHVESSSSIDWNNQTHGNYWQQYDGIDSDGDGIGDSPYEIDSTNVDQYPLMYLSSFRVLTERESFDVSLTSVMTSPEKPMSSDSVTIRIDVDKQNLVSRIILSYSVDGGSTWNNVSANRVDGYWQAEIPAQPAGSIVQYKVIIYNVLGELIVSSIQEYTVEWDGLLALSSPVVIFAIVIGVAVVAAGLMVRQGRKKKKYDEYDTQLP